MSLDKDKIASIMALEDQKEAKNKLAAYAQDEFGIKLIRTKSLANMLKDLEEQAPADEDQKGHAPTKEQLEEFLSDSPVDQNITVVESEDQEPETEEPTPAPEKKEEAEPEENPTPDPEPETVSEEPQQEKPRVSKTDKPEWLDTFSPHVYMMNRTAGSNGWCTCPYWIYDWIKANIDDWYLRFDECPHYDARQTLQSLAYYVHIDGYVVIRETRNSRFVRLEK